MTLKVGTMQILLLKQTTKLAELSVRFISKKTKILLVRKCYGNSLSNSILTKTKP